MPIEPPQQFLAHIHQRYEQLRGKDQLPATLDAWEEQKRQLRQKLLESWGGFPKEPCELSPQKLGELKREGYRVEKIVFHTRPGILMTANAYVPDGEGPRPAVLIVHGHWKGAKQDPVPQSRCISLVKQGFFVLAVDAFGAGERAIGKALGEYHGEMTGTTLWPVGLPLSGLQVYENMRAVDYLLTRPEVDDSKLAITGASGGGNQTMYAGAFDERFACVVPVCSVGNYRSYLGAAACVCEIVPDIITYTEEWALLAMVAPRALMVINATRDAFQFSVGEAQKSVAGAQHVYRLYGQAGKIAHAIFESGHDYNGPMREAMSGWVTLHLKGEGQGNPIPEQPFQTEDPETLRCYPGDTRPDSFVTLPQFAAAEADKLIVEHHRDRPLHLEHWKTTAIRMKHALEHGVLGGFPKSEGQEPEAAQGGFRLETEPGIHVAVEMRSRDPGKKSAILLDLEGMEHARAAEISTALFGNGWDLALADLRGTGAYAVKGDQIGRAPDHNSAEWGTLTGRPLLGQWAWDARSVVRWVRRMRNTPEGTTLVAIGPAGLVALCAAAFDPDVSRVVLVNPLASFKSDVPYAGQRMGLMAPRILRDVGDIPHLAALLAPRKLLISGGVTGGGEPLDEAALKQQFTFTRDVYRLYGVEAHLTNTAAEKPEDVVRRLG